MGVRKGNVFLSEEDFSFHYDRQRDVLHDDEQWKSRRGPPRGPMSPESGHRAANH
jgi:hypothetical protein